MPASPQARGGLERLLEEQYAQSPREEPFEGRTRPDTFTWHNGEHRGVVWVDKRREVLWLLCFADGHDAGYDKGHELADEDPERDRLYPKLDPDFDGTESAAAWGEFADEDMLEWIRFVEGAAHEFEPSGEGQSGPFEFGQPVGCLRLVEDDGLLKLTVGRRLLYESSDRDRYLSDEEMTDLVHQLAGDPDEDLIEPHVPPHVHGFVNFYIAVGLVTAREWLKGRTDEMTEGKARRGNAPTEI